MRNRKSTGEKGHDGPAAVHSTSVSFTPRAAAMLPMPDVMHAAMACIRNSTGVGA
jgi:hypothetical protein